jgi:hypothetical protein
MKNIFYVLLLIIYISVSATSDVSARVDFLKTRLYISTNGSQFDKLIFGVDRRATARLDTALGEFYTPGFKPPEPADIQGYFDLGYVDSTIMEEVYSYMDIRPFPTNPGDSVAFKFHLDAIRDTLTISWFAFGNEIDSAFLIESATGKRLDMKANTYYSRQIFASELNLRLVVWYNLDFLDDVRDDFVLASQGNTNGNIITNPASDRVLLDAPANANDFRIVSVTGLEVANGRLLPGINEINSQGFAPGVYFLILRFSDGHASSIKFIKL